MNKPVMLLLHGIGGDTDSSFFPLLKNTFKDKAKILAPSLPETEKPVSSEWIKATEELLIREEISLTIGYSLGGTLAMNMISQGKLKTSTLITIGSSHGPKDDKLMDAFLAPRIDMTALKELEQFYAVASYDDPATCSDYSSLLVKQAGATGIFYNKWGHFLDNDLPPLVLKIIDDNLS